MTTSDTAIAAGWYTDPAGPDSLRWWDGVHWTGHVQPGPNTPAPAPLVQRDPFALPAVTGPRVDPYSNQTSSYSSARRNVAVNNTSAWVGLVAGIVSMFAILLRFSDPGLGFYLPVFGITAISASIRALARYRRGSIAVVWAPIIGLVLGTISEVILISLFLFSLANSTGTFENVALNGPTVGGSSGTGTGIGVPPDDTINYSMGQSSIQYAPSGNDVLTNVANQEAALVARMNQLYAGGTYPSSLHLNTNGDVVAGDGTVLGHYLQRGWFIAYNIESDGSFALEMTGPSTDEVAVYFSATAEYWAWCGSADTSCRTGSPVAPSTSQSPSIVSSDNS